MLKFQLAKIKMNYALIDKVSSASCILNSSSYHLFLNAQGQILSDAIIYPVSKDVLYIISSNIEDVVRYIKSYSLRDPVECERIQDCFYSKNLTSGLCIKDPRNAQLGYWSCVENDMDEYYDDKARNVILDIDHEVPKKSFPFQYGLYVDLNKGCFVGQEVCQHLSRRGHKKYKYVGYKDYQGMDEVVFQHGQFCIVKEANGV